MATNQKHLPTRTGSTAARMLERPEWLSWLMVFGLVALVALFAMSDARELWRAARALDVRLLALPMLASIASYLAMARSYQDIARAAGYAVPFREMLKVTFVANTANYLITTGGLSGFAVRMYFFLRMSVPSGRAVTISLVQTFITNLILLLFVLAGFFYLLQTQELQGFALVATATLSGAFALATLVAVFLLIHHEVRRRTLFILAQLAHGLLGRMTPRLTPRRVRIWRFQHSLDRGIRFLLERKRHMIAPILWIAIDWVATLCILYTSFVAVGHAIPPSFVVVGFAVGIVLSLVSLVPGGLGIMEGSMAAVFAGLGVSFEVAIIAVLIFRVAYYVFPLVVSLFFFRSMLVQSTREVVELDSLPRLE